MFTVCPKCTLTLVVTTVDLRAGQGYVRCGRCANVFNALVALREGDPNAGTADSASRRLSETAPKPPVQPAFGAGVAVEPEPEPEPEPAPAPEPQPEPEPAPEPEPEPEPEDEPSVEIEFPSSLEAEAAPVAEHELELAPEPATLASEDASLEFDDTATDVSEIFISAADAERGSGSGNYEAVVLAVEPPPEPEPEPEPDPRAEQDDPSHTETIAAEDWSLLDDDVPIADAESVIEESPLAVDSSEEPSERAPQESEETSQQEAQADPEWVQEMFAEAEAEAERARTAERPALAPVTEEEDDEPAAVQAARDVKGVSASSGDTVLEPLLTAPVRSRPTWQYASAVCVLVLALIAQILHHNRQALVLKPAVGPAMSTVYGWFGAALTPRWDLTAYKVTQRGVETEDTEGTRLRVRLSVQNDSDRVQPLPLVRLTLKDRYNNAVATRDLTPAEYLPPRAAAQRLLEPDQRIDAELHVMDPGRAAVGFEIDACLRADDGSVGCANEARAKSAG